MTKKDIIAAIEKDSWMMEILQIVKSLALPDWWIGAGFVRSKVWDMLHKYTKRTPLGIDDLVRGIIRPNPQSKSDRDLFERRIKEKEWLKKWPKLKIVYN